MFLDKLKLILSEMHYKTGSGKREGRDRILSSRNTQRVSANMHRKYMQTISMNIINVHSFIEGYLDFGHVCFCTAKVL